jgi:hypothetical protein
MEKLMISISLASFLLHSAEAVEPRWSTRVRDVGAERFEREDELELPPTHTEAGLESFQI